MYIKGGGVIRTDYLLKDLMLEWKDQLIDSRFTNTWWLFIHLSSKRETLFNLFN